MTFDEDNHGTSVAGVIRAQMGPYIGMADQCTLINVKCIGGGALDSAPFAAALWATEPTLGAKVLNMSFNSGVEASGLDPNEIRFDYLATALPEVVFVNSMSKDPEKVTTPSGAYNTIVVNAFDDAHSNDVAKHMRGYFKTSEGPVALSGLRKPDLSAPGAGYRIGDDCLWSARVWEWEFQGQWVKVLRNDMSHEYTTDGGSTLPFAESSYAAPHVSGAAALIKSPGVFEGSTNIAVKAILVNTARAPRGKRLEPGRTPFPPPPYIAAAMADG